MPKTKQSFVSACCSALLVQMQPQKSGCPTAHLIKGAGGKLKEKDGEKDKNTYFKAKKITAAEHGKQCKTSLRKLWDSKTWLPPKNPTSMAQKIPDKDIFKQPL